jgi:hypothetical protein
MVQLSRPIKRPANTAKPAKKPLETDRDFIKSSFSCETSSAQAVREKNINFDGQVTKIKI